MGFAVKKPETKNRLRFWLFGLHPVLPGFALQDDAFLVVSSASCFWAEFCSLFSLNLGRLRPNFSSFRQRTMSWHDYTPETQ